MQPLSGSEMPDDDGSERRSLAEEGHGESEEQRSHFAAPSPDRPERRRKLELRAQRWILGIEFRDFVFRGWEAREAREETVCLLLVGGNDEMDCEREKE